MSKAARCAIQHCSDNGETAEQLRTDLRNIPYHVLNVHNNCRPYFCKAKRSQAVLPSCEDEYSPTDSDDSSSSDSDLEDSHDTESVADGLTTSSEYTTMVEEGLFEKIANVIEDLAAKADFLYTASTSNNSEAVFASVVKYVGGKRLNLSSRGSYERRAKMGYLQYNNAFEWQSKIFTTFIESSPPGALVCFLNGRKKKTKVTEIAKSKETFNRRSRCYKKNDDYCPAHEREADVNYTEDELNALKDKYTVSNAFIIKKSLFILFML